MNQFMMASVCRIIIGPTGHRLTVYPNIQSAYMDGLFADFFRYNPHLSEETFRKHCRGTKPYPRNLIRHYSGPTGYRRTLGDMMGVCDACPSLSTLCDIQNEIHRWICEYLPEADHRTLDLHYIADHPSRYQIAQYLAVTLHYSISVAA